MKVRILIIDDEIDYCMIMKSYFLGKGYDVFQGSTIKDCFRLLEESRPDILLLDNNLPDGKAWEQVDTIHKNYPSLRIYLISAYHQKTDVIPTHENLIVWEKPISFSLLDQTF